MINLADQEYPATSPLAPSAACRPLCTVAPCTRCVIASMGATEPSRVRYLAALGLMPDSCLTVEARAPFGGPVLLSVGCARYAMGREAAEQIMVRPADAADSHKVIPAGNR